MTDLGALHYFLGISVTRTSSSMFLSQSKYAFELLVRAGMSLASLQTPPLILLLNSLLKLELSWPILLRIEAWQEPYSTSHSHVPTSHTPCNRFFFICMTRMSTTSTWLNMCFGTSKAPSNMVFGSPNASRPLSLPTPMLTGLVAPTHGDLPPATVSF